MARRVNTRFVLILAAVLVILSAGLTVTWYFVVRADPAELVARGDAMAKQGQYSQAATFYNRALSRRKTDVPLLIKYVETINQVPLTDQHDADTYLRQTGDFLRICLNLDTRNETAYVKLMELYMTLGRDFGSPNAYQAMHDQSLTWLNTSPQSAPGHKYRGIALVMQMRTLNVVPEKRQMANDDLTMALKTMTDDPDALLALASWNVLEAKLQDRPGGKIKTVAPMRATALSLLSTAAEAHPKELRRLLDMLTIAQELDDQATVARVSQSLESQLLADPKSSELIITLSLMLPSIDRKPAADVTPGTGATSGIRRAEALLRAGLAVNPSNQRMQFALGLNLQNQGRIDEAMPLLQATMDQSKPLPAVELLRRNAQSQIAKLYFAGMLLDKSQGEIPAKERQALIAQSQQQLDQLNNAVGTTGLVTFLQARIASINGDWEQALIKVDKAVNLLQAKSDNHSDPALLPALLLSARARLVLGQTGAAAERLTQILENRPNAMPARLELIRVYLRTKQWEQAQNQIDAILKTDPKNIDGIQLRAALLSETGQNAMALALLKNYDVKKYPDIAKTMAQVYIHDQQLAAARSLLDARLRQQPDDTTALALIAQTSDNPADLQPYLDAARKAGVSEQTLVTTGRLRNADRASTLDKLSSGEQDPFEKRWLKYLSLRDANQIDAARLELEQAAKLRPDEEKVVEQQFNFALIDKKLDLAQSIAEKAVAKNYDYANGTFYLGRLEMARGRYDAAVAQYDQGLKIRPVFAQGWLMLADARRMLSDFSGAAAAYQKAVDQQPDNLSAMRGLATVNEQMGNTDQALQWYRRASDVWPDDPNLRAEYLTYEQFRGDPKRAMAGRLALLKTDPNNLPNRRALAILYAQTGQGPQALQCINDLIAQQPAEMDNRITLAMVQRTLGDEAGARNGLNSYVTGLGDKAGARSWLAFAQFLAAGGAPQDAVNAYRQAIKLEDPKQKPASRELADFYWDQQAYDQSLPIYQDIYQATPEDPRVADRLTDALIQNRKLDDAEKIIRLSEAKRSGDSKIMILRATLARARKDDESALQWVNKAIDASPLWALAYYKRAEMLSAKPERDAKTMADLNKALELEPGMIPARVLLASVYQRRGERSESIRELQAVLRHQPNSLEARTVLVTSYFESEQWLPLKLLLDESVKLYPRDGRWPRFQARAAQLSGKNNDVLPYLKKALQLDPSPINIADVATFQIRANRLDAALKTLTDYSSIVNQNPTLLSIWGWGQFLKKDQASAMTSFAKALKLCTTFSETLTVVQQMVIAMGPEEALSQLQPLVPSSGGVRLIIAMAQIDVERMNYKSALERLTQVESQIAADAPERLLFDRIMALSLHQTNQFEKAAVAYQRILSRSPNDIRTLNNLAYVLTDGLGRPKEALPLASKAAELLPNDPVVLDTLGWTQYNAGMVEEAQKNLELSTKTKPLAAACLHLAVVQLSRGQKQAGIESLQLAKRLAESNKDAQTLTAVGKRLAELGKP